jgi:hypothetical protein
MDGGAGGGGSLGPRELGLGSTKKGVLGDLRQGSTKELGVGRPKRDYLGIGSTRSVGRPRRGYLRLGSTRSVGRPRRGYLRLGSTKKSGGGLGMTRLHGEA